MPVEVAGRVVAEEQWGVEVAAERPTIVGPGAAPVLPPSGVYQGELQ